MKNINITQKTPVIIKK